MFIMQQTIIILVSNVHKFTNIDIQLCNFFVFSIIIHILGIILLRVVKKK